VRSEQEHWIVGFCHLINIVPLWGLLICGGIWFRLREESREVVLHAQQAILFHIMMLCAVLIWSLVLIFVKIVQKISEPLALVIDRINDAFVLVLFIVYALICLFGCIQCLQGRSFRYPLVRIQP